MIIPLEKKEGLIERENEKLKHEKIQKFLLKNGTYFQE